VIYVEVVCEGHTEAQFTKKVMQPFLASGGIILNPRLIATSRTGRGGGLNRDRVLRHLRNTLRQRSDTYVTTLFDLYGLGHEFPGYRRSVYLQDPIQRVRTIEAELHAATIEASGSRPDRFIPHIQPYEFESLLFSDVQRFVDTEPRWGSQVDQLREIRQAVSSPEHINDGENTHPSARLKALPGYRKVRHGVDVIHHIGLDTVRSECRHFGQWLARLENLRSLSEVER